MKTPFAAALLAAVFCACAFSANRFWPGESMDPLSATYGAFEQVVSPASKADAGGVSAAFSFSSTGTNFDPGVRAAFNLGVLGIALYQTPGPAGNLVDGSIWSLALPVHRGITLGYALRTEASNAEHDLSAVLRPLWWMSLGLAVHNIGLSEPALTGALSFRPFGEVWTLSYQWNAALLKPSTHSFYSDLRLFKAVNLQVKYDFNELYTGLSLDLGGVTLADRTTVLASNRFTAYRHTVEWHAREPGLQPPGPANARPLRGRKAQTWVPLVLRGAPKAILGRVEGLEYIPSLLELHQVVNTILEAPGVRGLFLELDGFGGGYGVMDELRGEIRRLRDSGRRVVVFANGYSQPEYFAASAANQVILSKVGEVDLKGLRFEGYYLRDFLDFVGVSVDVVQAGNYKSFGEPYIRTNRSPFAREEEEHLLSVFVSNIFPEIQKSRRLKQSVDELLSKGPYSSAQAHEAGLIDRVAYREEALEQLRQEGVVFRSAAALFADRERAWEGSLDPSIAVIEITGSIIDGESYANPLTGAGATGSTTVLRALDQALANPATRAILVRVDSGGGSVSASDLIWNRLARIATDTKRLLPVIVSFGDVAASGGYYVSASAGRIFASPMTITGSIGVIYTRPSIEGLLAKLKITTDGSGIGPMAGSGSLARPLNPEQRDKTVREIMAAYREFLDVVRLGRTGKGRFKPDELETIAQGRVWTGRDALTNGLADAPGGVGVASEYVEDVAFAPADRLSWVFYNPTLDSFPGIQNLLGLRLSFLTAGARRLVSWFNPAGKAAPLGLVSTPLSGAGTFDANPAHWIQREFRSQTGLQVRASDRRPVTAP
ncbi:MAG: S49 family peptidase [Spirochaetes bacterium]|nr:S49 family peptidase [Spirochaetota bacterium]